VPPETSALDLSLAGFASNATYRPSSLIDGKPLWSLPSTPAASQLTLTVVFVSRSRR